MLSKKLDAFVSIISFFLLLMFFAAMRFNDDFFHWAFERHHNTWSWYIRPLFLIPFCLFAYRKSLSGIALTVLALFTSMFWFPKPDIVSGEVVQFLDFEKNWLAADWTLEKILMIITVPVSLGLLALACWKRSLWMGIGVMVLMATGKMVWSITNAGESGKSILIPAVSGLVICILVVFMALKRKK